MTDNSLSRVVWRVSIPIIFAQASETILHLIDALYLARVGVTELGALAIADSMLALFLVVPLAVVDGIQVLTARRSGQRRPDAVGAAFNQGFAYVLLICIASVIALKLASPLVAALFVESDAVGDAVDDYLQIEAYGIPFAGLAFAYGALLVALGRTWVLVPATLLLATTQIALNYVLIFGHLGFPALGMRGAALGSVGAELAAFCFLTVYVWRRLDSGRYAIFRFRGFDRRTVLLLSGLSAPIAGQGALQDLRWFIFFLIFEHVSTQALAIANIAYTCYAVFAIPMEGFDETACSMVSRFVGRNQAHRIGALLRSTIGGAVLVTVPFIVAGLIFPQWFVGLFSPETELAVESAATLRVVALAMLIVIPGHMWYSAVVGTGDTVVALGIEIIFALVMLGITYVAAIHLAWPVALAWISLPIAWLVCLSLSYGWMMSGIWKRLRI